MDGGPGSDPGLWRETAEFGWCGALVPEDLGGSVLDIEFASILLEEVGRQLAPCPLVSSAVLATTAQLEAGTREQRQAFLPPLLARGERIGTVPCRVRADSPTDRTFASRASVIATNSRAARISFRIYISPISWSSQLAPAA